MQHVELYGSHSVQCPLHHSDGKKMPSRIEHQAAPRKARRILNVDSRERISIARDFRELQQCLHAVQRADVGFGAERCVLWINIERVALIHSRLRHVSGGGCSNFDRECSLRPLRRGQRRHRHAGARLEPLDQSLCRTAYARARVSTQHIGERAVDWQQSVSCFKRRR